jgi:hypothetical protein
MGNIIARKIEICNICGRDRNASFHDGFNGYFIDENLMCIQSTKVRLCSD